MANPITVKQVLELARQLSTEERRALVDRLLAERFDAVMNESDRKQSHQPNLSDHEIQSEVVAVRDERRTVRSGL